MTDTISARPWKFWQYTRFFCNCIVITIQWKRIYFMYGVWSTYIKGELYTHAKRATKSAEKIKRNKTNSIIHACIRLLLYRVIHQACTLFYLIMLPLSTFWFLKILNRYTWGQYFPILNIACNISGLSSVLGNIHLFLHSYENIMNMYIFFLMYFDESKSKFELGISKY